MTRVLGRARAALRRSLRAARRAASGLALAAPGRATGAVQGPLRSVVGVSDVWGWAWLGKTPVAAVYVTVDGRIVQRAVFERVPPDVVLRHPETRGSHRCGWRARIDFAPYAGREVALGAIVLSADGAATDAEGVPVEVGGSPVGSIDRPLGDGPAAGVIQVTGWTLPDGGPPSRIEVRLDDRPVGTARPFVVPRLDLAATSTLPHAPVAGFEHTVLLEDAAASEARIDVDVIARDGTRSALAPLVVSVAAPPALEQDGERSRVLDGRIRAVGPRPPDAGAPPVRIAAFTHQLDLGGGQLYLQELLLGLLRDPSMSCLVVSAGDGPLRDELERAGATVHITQYPMRSIDDYDARLLELAHLVRAHDANVVLVNTMIAAPGADLARRLGLPVVWSIHESFRLAEYWGAAYGPDGIAPGVRTAVTEALRAASAVVFEAERTRSAYLGIGDDRRFVTVPYGIDVGGIAAFVAGADRAVVRRDLGLAESETAVVSVATFESRKAQAALALAFAELAGDFPDAVLVLVGANDTQYADAVRDVVRRAGLDDRVRLEPVTSRVYEWYLACDAFVLPSDVESMPRSLLEVLAFGRPVAASAAWGVPELIRDGENGLLFEPRDLDALVRTLRRLLSMEPEARRRLGDAGARMVREHHAASGYVEAYRRLLRGVIEDPAVLPGVLLGS